MLAGGRFRLTEQLSFGTCAEVWKAIDTASVEQRPVALKIFRPDAIGDASEPWAVVYREIETCRILGPHPHLVTPWALLFVEHFPGPATPCLVMELIEGGNLAEWLVAQPPPGPDTFTPRWAVLQDVLTALAHAHARGIVHGDLGFGNVLVTASGRAVLTDFGSSASFEDGGDMAGDDHGDTEGLQPLAPPPYGRPVGGRVGAQRDLYAFGALGYLTLTGRHPLSDDWQSMRAGAWRGPAFPHSTLGRRTLSDLAPWILGVPRLRALEPVLLRCVAAVAAERPATAIEVLDHWPPLIDRTAV